MNRRQKIIVSVVGIFIVLLALVGLTYAYFLTQIKGNTNDKSIHVTTANLRLVYGGDDGGVIGGENILPSDTEYTKTFTVTNEGNETITYSVYLIDVINTFARKDDIKYTLTCDTCNGTSETTFPSGISNLVENEIAPGVTHTYTFTFTYKNLETTDQSEDMGKELSAKIQIFAKENGEYFPYEEGTLAYNIINNARHVTEEEIGKGYAELLAAPQTMPAKQISGSVTKPGYETEEDIVEIETADTQNWYWTYATDYKINSGGTFSLVDPKTCKYNEAGCIPDLVGNGETVYVDDPTQYLQSTEENVMLATENLVNVYRVTDAPAATDTDINVTYRRMTLQPESTLTTTEDDLGTSYYYRGDVKNNYLTFNNMCWRIVRIEGDGSVRIVLADDEAPCSTETLTKTDSAFISISAFGTKEVYEPAHYYYPDFDSVEFTDNPKRGSVFSVKWALEAFINGGTYNIVENGTLVPVTFTSWSEESKNKLKTVKLYLNDLSKYYDKNGNEVEDIYSVNSIYYKKYKSLNLDYAPTLKNDINGTKLNDSKVFLLTADEIVYAGGKVNTKNYSYYLNDNTSSDNSWWTLSAAQGFYASGIRSTMFLVKDGMLYNGSSFEGLTTNKNSIRPAVSLLFGAEVLEGNGSIEDPYQIK